MQKSMEIELSERFEDGINLRFQCRPKGSSHWTRKRENIEAIKNGRFLDVMPETLEFAPTLACSYNCCKCPYPKPVRLELGQFAVPDDLTTITLHSARGVIDQAVSAGINGLVGTGGGEPTTHPQLPEILRYSASLGVTNCLYTNGTMLGAHYELADELVRPESNLAFIRHSRNFSDPKTAAKFARVSSQAVQLQSSGWMALLEARERNRDQFQAVGKEPPALMVSYIADSINVGDLLSTCREVAQAYKDIVKHSYPYDSFVVRPTTLHKRKSYSTHDHPKALIGEILDIVGIGSPGTEIVEKAGMQMKLGFGLQLVDEGKFPTYDSVLEAEYNRRDKCWMNGLFLTVGPDSVAYFCCDRNCYPDWAIGNLKTNTVFEVWHSEARKTLFRRVHEVRCGASQCEATCRTCRLNEVARDVRLGLMDDISIENARVQSVNDTWPLLS